MKLLTKDLVKKLPAIGTTSAQNDPMVVCKFFTPWTQWTWFATEFDGKDEFFGRVDGLERELRYFSLQELEGIRGPMDLKIERDLYFEPCRISELNK